jgi:hypothetical protein
MVTIIEVIVEFCLVKICKFTFYIMYKESYKDRSQLFSSDHCDSGSKSYGSGLN